VGFHAGLVKINEFLAQRSSVLPAGSISFMDDINGCVIGDHAVETALKMVQVASEYGLTANVHKSKLIGKLVSELTNVPTGFATSSEGCIAVGCPVGSLTYRENTLEKKINEMTQELQHLDSVHSIAALNMIRYCINSRCAFLHRILGDVPVLRKLFQVFDSRIDQAIMRIVGFPVQHKSIVQVSIIRSLPHARGGLGIICHTGPVGIKGCLKVRFQYQKFLSDYYQGAPIFQETIDREWVPCSFPGDLFPIHLMETDVAKPTCWEFQHSANNQVTVAPLPIHDSVQTFSGALTQLVEEYNIGCSNSFAEGLRINPELWGHCAYFRSSQFRGSGNWLSGRGFQKGKYMFKHKEFQVLLCLRLLLPLSPGVKGHSNDRRNSCMCVCNKVVDFSTESTHFLHCKPLQQICFQRTHHTLTKAIARILKEFLPEGSTVATEQTFVAASPTGITASEAPDGATNFILPSNDRNTVRADITFKRPGESDPCLIDVTVGYGLRENAQILQDMYRSALRGYVKGYQLNDYGLGVCKVGVIRLQPFIT